MSIVGDYAQISNSEEIVISVFCFRSCYLRSAANALRSYIAQVSTSINWVNSRNSIFKSVLSDNYF